MPQPQQPAQSFDSTHHLNNPHVRQWLEWLSIPSISADSSHRDDTRRAGKWLAERFAEAGLSVEVVDTDGFPLVFAQTPPVPGTPIALVYGHYDVQPVDPLSLWISPPFEPSIRLNRNGDPCVHARGATDDKGQVLTHVQSVCDWVGSGAPLPLQVKFLIEGEEEIGSQNLDTWLPRLAERLKCDVVVVSDSSQYAPGRPAITCGLRGIATYELRVDGPSHDLHSGSFGGAVTNPAWALSVMMASLLDSDRKIAVEGFYENVLPLGQAEREAWEHLGADDVEFARNCGVNELAGERGFTTDQRRWARPSMDINGLTSGHQGEGVKTVLPATASAKFSFRLVPNQDPHRLNDLLQSHFEKHCPTGVRFELKPDHGAPAMLADAESPFARAATKAIEQAFGVPPVFIREGGSIPILARFQEVLRCDVLLLGWGQSDDAAHSPNEKFSINDFHRGRHAATLLWTQIAAESLSP